MERKNRGITLITLVITIILMLILAGIVLSLTLGENGIIKRAQESGIEYKKAEIKEEIETAILAIHAEVIKNNVDGKLNKEVIVNQLPEEIKEIIINNNMAGEYKGYEYWIDEEYKVHIGEKTNTKVYIVKDGIWNIERSLGNATITTENGYCRMTIASTEHRGGFWFNCDFTNYKTLKVDMEIIKKDMGSGYTSMSMGIWKQQSNPMSGNERSYKISTNNRAE